MQDTSSGVDDQQHVDDIWPAETKSFRTANTAYLGAHETAQGEGLVVAGVGARGGVDVADVDLHSGVVLGRDEALGPRAASEPIDIAHTADHGQSRRWQGRQRDSNTLHSRQRHGGHEQQRLQVAAGQGMTA